MASRSVSQSDSCFTCYWDRPLSQQPAQCQSAKAWKVNPPDTLCSPHRHKSAQRQHQHPEGQTHSINVQDAPLICSWLFACCLHVFCFPYSFAVGFWGFWLWFPQILAQEPFERLPLPTRPVVAETAAPRRRWRCCAPAILTDVVTKG